MEERISRMKVRLSHIVKEYGYPNVEAFYKAFHKAETAYGDYQDSLKNWNNGMEKSRSLYTIGLNLRNRTLGSES